MTDGVAYRLTRDGTVTEVLHHRIGGRTPQRGEPFVELLDATSMAKGLAFLRSLTTDGIALDWELDIADDPRPVRLHFSGVAERGRLLVIGADQEHAEELLAQISGVNNELTNRLRAALRHQAGADEVAGTLDELTQLNNDLTNLHRELAQKAAELERSNRRRNEMLGMAAHDLRNPLGAILGFAELLSMRAGDRLTEKERMMLDQIVASSGRMTRLIGDLLDLSAIDAGELRLDVQAVDLVALVAESAPLDADVAGAGKKDIALDLDLPEDPVVVEADAHKLGQVLSNLVSNAVKYSQPGTTLRVRVRARDDVAALEVQDEGQGIPEDERDRLFQPFGRASVETTAGESSTGLGLAIVQRIVEGHGGRIAVDSQVGVGSTFRVELPLNDG